MIERPIWWDYVKFNEEEGVVIGIEEGAPEEIKDAYAEYLRIKEEKDKN